LTKHETVPKFNSIPTSVEGFRGRQQEMCEVISLIGQNRLVNILGPPGIGKTSLSRNICNHLKDRRTFHDGIIYVGLRGCESAQMFLTRLSLAIQISNEKYQQDTLTLPNLESMKMNSESSENSPSKEDKEKMRLYISRVLEDKEVLIVLDG